MPRRRSYLRTAGSALLVALAGCTDGDGTEGSPSPTVHDGTTTPTPPEPTPTPTRDRLAWRARTGGRMRGPPAVADGTVYAASDALVAIDASSGGERWRFTPPAPGTSRPVATGDGVLLTSSTVVSPDGAVHALGPDGSQRWRWPPDDSAEQPRILGLDGNRVFVGVSGLTPEETGTNTPTPADLGWTGGSSASTRTPRSRSSAFVVGLDAATGAERWEFRLGDHSGVWQATVGRGALFVQPPQSTMLLAFDGDDGTVRWRFGEAGGGVRLVGDQVYAAGDVLAALDPATGTERWRFRPPAGQVGPLAAGSRGAVVADESGRLFAVDAADGSERWRASTEAEQFGIPVVASDDGGDGGAGDGGGAGGGTGDDVFVGDLDGRLFAFAAADGRERWRYDTGDERAVRPLVSADAVSTYTRPELDLHTVNRDDGTGRFTFPIGRYPALGEGRVYVGAENGTVYALDA